MKGLKKFNRLAISALSGYTLKIKDGLFDITECPGVKNLILKYDSKLIKDRACAEMKKRDYYPFL